MHEGAVPETKTHPPLRPQASRSIDVRRDFRTVTISESYEVESVLHSSWQPQLGNGTVDLRCTICGNHIDGDGETVEVDPGDTYHVCCWSCAEEIVEQYESLNEAADG